MDDTLHTKIGGSMNARIRHALTQRSYVRASYYTAQQMIRHGAYAMAEIARTREPQDFSRARRA